MEKFTWSYLTEDAVRNEYTKFVSQARLGLPESV